MSLRRGTCYAAPEQKDGTVGLLVLSNNVANRTTREATACPVFEAPPHDRAVPVGPGWANIEVLTPRSAASLPSVAFEAGEEELDGVGRALADLLLIPELTTGGYVAPEPPAGDYPRWGAIYYAEPPLSGQIKRWMVVSNDVFNASSDDVLCVRTTSRTDLQSPEIPLLQSGFAAAVCPDVQVKAQRRFDVASASELPQPDASDRRRVAYGLANYLRLQTFAGRTAS